MSTSTLQDMIYVDKLPEVGELPEGTWAAFVDVRTTRYPLDADDRIPHTERPLIIVTSLVADVLPMNGGDLDGAVCYIVRTPDVVPGHYSSNWQKCLIVAANAFMVVATREGTRRSLRQITARQIRHGELGRKPTLRVQPTLDIESWIAFRDRPRQAVQWVTVANVATITGLTPMQILTGFAAFSPSTVYEASIPMLTPESLDRRGGLNLKRVYIGTIPDDFCLAEQEWGGSNVASLRDFDPEHLGEFRIPRSFASTVIRLVQAGYQPEGTMPESALHLEAPCPDMPPHQFPVRSLEELTPWRQTRDSDVTKEVFRQAALSALALPRDTEWASAPQSDDGGSFRYNTDFEQVERDTGSGQVVIGSCFWSRGGAGTGEFHAGYLAVFPLGVAVEDARRDHRAILRVWFWPGELVRETPEGSADEFCPPEVPSDCSVILQRCLLDLGYDL